MTDGEALEFFRTEIDVLKLTPEETERYKANFRAAFKLAVVALAEKVLHEDDLK